MKKWLREWKAAELLSAFFCMGLGIIWCLYPENATMGICRGLGIIITFYGAAFMILYLSAKEHRGWNKLHLFTGMVLAVVGIWILVYPAGIAGLIPYVAGGVLIIHGIKNLQEAFYLKGCNFEKWWMVLLAGMLILAEGGCLLFRPLENLEKMALWVGIFFIVDGLVNGSIACVVVYVNRHLKQSMDEIYREVKALDVEGEELSENVDNNVEKVDK